MTNNQFSSNQQTNNRKNNSKSSNSTTKKKTKSTAEKAFTKVGNSALTTFGRKLGNGIYKLFKK